MDWFIINLVVTNMDSNWRKKIKNIDRIRHLYKKIAKRVLEVVWRNYGCRRRFTKSALLAFSLFGGLF